MKHKSTFPPMFFFFLSSWPCWNWTEEHYKHNTIEKFSPDTFASTDHSITIDLSRVECILRCWGCRVSAVRCRECIIRWVQRPHRCVKPSSLRAWWIHSLVPLSWLWKPSPPSAVMVPHSMRLFRPSKLIGVTNTFQNKPLSSQVWNLDLTPLLFNAESSLLIKLMWRRFHCVSFYMWGTV